MISVGVMDDLCRMISVGMHLELRGVVEGVRWLGRCQVWGAWERCTISVQLGHGRRVARHTAHMLLPLYV